MYQNLTHTTVCFDKIQNQVDEGDLQASNWYPNYYVKIYSVTGTKRKDIFRTL